MITREQVQEWRKWWTADKGYATIEGGSDAAKEILNTLEALWNVAEAAKKFHESYEHWAGVQHKDLHDALAALEGKE